MPERKPEDSALPQEPAPSMPSGAQPALCAPSSAEPARSTPASSTPAATTTPATSDATAASAATDLVNDDFTSQLKPLLENKRVEQLHQDKFDVAQAVGGWRGLAETTIPAVAFIVVYVTTHSAQYSLWASLAFVAALVGVRLLQREPLRYALSGVLGIAISAVWVLWSGQARDFFAWGLVVNLVWAAALLLTLALRTPLVSWLLGLLTELPAKWWRRPANLQLAGVGLQLTWMWAALFVLRLATQAPLWYTNQVVALGIVRLLLGVPAVLLLSWITWKALRPFIKGELPSELATLPASEDGAGRPQATA